MKVKIRNSKVKVLRKHGFRAKPASHRASQHKRKPGGQGNRRGRVVR